MQEEFLRLEYSGIPMGLYATVRTRAEVLSVLADLIRTRSVSF